MKSIVNLLRGVLELTVRGPFPERLLNLCAQEGVAFWGLVWEDEHTFSMCVRRCDRKKTAALAQRVGCETTVEGSWGLPFFLGRFRTRYAFLVGFALSLAAVCVLSSFIFTIQVTGNEQVPTAQILGELRRLGLRPGVYGPGLELKQISQEALLVLKDLSWMTINLYGTRAEVIVREVVQPPELVEEEGCYDIVSEADGLVVHVEALNGEALVREGDTILAGDVLITGHVSMKPPQYSDLPVRYFQTHARGRVVARTWRTMTARIPTAAWVKNYTGEEKNRYSLTIFGRTMDFSKNSSISWPFYDKITDVYPAVLGEVRLPVLWTRQRLRAYELERVEVDRDAAQVMLEGELQKRLEQAVGKDGSVESTRFSAQMKDGWLTVTLAAQCLEEVGRETPADYGPEAGTGEETPTAGS